jgi:hypothetical protein
VVEGDVGFGADVVVKGAVRVTNKSGRVVHIPDGRVLERDTILE